MKELKKRKNAQYCSAIALVLLLSLCVSLVGCDGGGEGEFSGLDITDDLGVPYGDETMERAYNVIYASLESYYRASLGMNLSENTKSEIKTYAQGIRDISVSYKIPERDYLKMLSLFEERGNAAMTELALRVKGSGGDGEVLKSFFVSLLSCVGQDYLSRLVYNTLVFGFESAYQKKMKNYEKYSYGYLLLEAEAIALELEILKNDIGEESFGAVSKVSLVFSEVFFGGAFSSEAFAEFSDEEILTFINHINIASVDISARGWELIYSYILRVLPPDSYSAALLSHATDTSDIKRISEVSTDAFSLIVSAQNKINEDNISALRFADRESLAASLFSAFTDEEWQTFEKITSVKIDSEGYTAIAKERFGDGFSSYLDSASGATLSELRASVGGEDFMEKLHGYIYSICPAFSYGLE